MAAFHPQLSDRGSVRGQPVSRDDFRDHALVLQERAQQFDRGGRAPAGPKASPELTCQTDHSKGAGHREEGELEIEIEGDIVKMIELPDGSGSSMQDVYRRSVKVVAGTGFEPVTFRL